MREATKKKAKYTRVRLLMLILSTVLALTAFLICEFAVGKEDLGFSPFFMLFIVFFMCVGLGYLIYAFIRKSTLVFSIGGLSFIAGAFILMLCLHLIWYVVLVVTLALCAVVFFSVFLFKAPETTLEFDNGEGSDRKPYEQRKAEEDEQRAIQLATEKEKELPQIKSFKD